MKDHRTFHSKEDLHAPTNPDTDPIDGLILCVDLLIKKIKGLDERVEDLEKHMVSCQPKGDK